MNDWDDEVIAQVVQDPDVRKCLKDAGLEFCEPMNALDISDTLGEIKNEPSEKYDSVPGDLLDIIQKKFQED